MKKWIFLILILAFSKANAQYSFSGYVNDEDWQNRVYLSIVEDYRKMSGVYSEQIIAKVNLDSLGYFEFNGNQLENNHNIYRIHVDNCEENVQDVNHFNGHCSDSKEILFIAKNSDTIILPFSFNKEMFCDLKSTNIKATTLIKIDSIRAEMHFAFGEIRSEANKKLNNKKWFKTLQGYGKNLNEPLAELYIYSFLSDRSGDLHDFYLIDLKSNSYYNELEQRLTNEYPNSTYTKQYKNEIASDRYVISHKENVTSFKWSYLIYAILTLSILGNIFLFNWLKKMKSSSNTNLKSHLTKQEQNVLDHLLTDKSNKEIAETLFVSISTIKSHTNNIYKKLNVQTRESLKSLFSR